MDISMDLPNLFMTISLITSIIVSLILINRKSKFVSTTAFLIFLIFTAVFNSLPAQATPNLAALGARDNAITEQQQSLEEDLKLTPGGGHYSGIEYARRTTTEQRPVSDETIKETLDSYTNDNLVVSVTNGAVKLSGRVKDKEIAQHVVEEIKEIPGVHEITFDIGLENQAL